MRSRIIISLLAFCLLIHAGPAWSLGLGDARVESFIGQPLQMRIDLITAPSDDLESVSARLASAEDFAMIGASRSALSVPLRFTVREGEDGAGAHILVTSQLPVNDPVLRLVVEVNWASGRLLREYTVFLDPPTVPSRAPAPQPSARAERPAPTEGPVSEADEAAEVADSADPRPAPSVVRESPPPADQTPERAAGTSASAGEAYGPVRSGDTLWRVAQNYIGQSAMDMNQVMLAIQRRNPEAFVDDNINLLMRGATLEMPTTGEVEAISRQRARELVAQQEAAFRMRSSLASASTPLLAAESTMDSPLADAPEGADAGPGAESRQGDTSSQARLEIVPASEENLAAEPGTGAVPGGEGSDEVQRDLREELARTEEELISERQQNEYLRERINELEAQIAEAEGVSEGLVADDELANLEDRLAEERLEARDAAEEQAAETPAAETNRADIPSVTTTGGGEDRPWYSGPVIWIIMIVIVVAGVIGWVFNRRRGMDYDLEANRETAVSGLTGEAEEILRTLDSDRRQPDDTEQGGVIERRVPEAVDVYEDEPEDEAGDEPQAEAGRGKESADERGAERGTEREGAEGDIDDEELADEGTDDEEADPPVVPLERARRRHQEDDDDAKVLDENSSDPEIKLDLARAYISMGDKEAARVILEEVLATGDDEQKSEAGSMMNEL